MINYTEGEEYEIIAGLSYILVQTANAPTGEARGQADRGTVLLQSGVRGWEQYD